MTSINQVIVSFNDVEGFNLRCDNNIHSCGYVLGSGSFGRLSVKPGGSTQLKVLLHIYNEILSPSLKSLSDLKV